jgi:hypothetical protein
MKGPLPEHTLVSSISIIWYLNFFPKELFARLHIYVSHSWWFYEDNPPHDRKGTFTITWTRSSRYATLSCMVWVFNDKKHTAITKFFFAYPHTLDIDSFRRVLTQTINSAKAINPAVRLNSIALFKALIARSDPLDPDNLSGVAVPDLLNLPKSGKSVGPDHRIALYSMWAYLTPASTVSSAKPGVRRVFCGLAGSVFFQEQDGVETERSQKRERRLRKH